MLITLYVCYRDVGIAVKSSTLIFWRCLVSISTGHRLSWLRCFSVILSLSINFQDGISIRPRSFYFTNFAVQDCQLSCQSTGYRSLNITDRIVKQTTKIVHCSVLSRYYATIASKYTRGVSRQRLSKYFPTTTNTHARIEVPLETMFYTRSMQRGYNEDPVWRLKLGGGQAYDRSSD
jgi:hypothetical protein